MHYSTYIIIQCAPTHKEGIHMQLLKNIVRYHPFRSTYWRSTDVPVPTLKLRTKVHIVILHRHMATSHCVSTAILRATCLCIVRSIFTSQNFWSQTTIVFTTILLSTCIYVVCYDLQTQLPGQTFQLTSGVLSWCGWESPWIGQSWQSTCESLWTLRCLLHSSWDTPEAGGDSDIWSTSETASEWACVDEWNCTVHVRQNYG